MPRRDGSQLPTTARSGSRSHPAGEGSGFGVCPCGYVQVNLKVRTSLAPRNRKRHETGQRDPGFSDAGSRWPTIAALRRFYSVPAVSSGCSRAAGRRQGSLPPAPCGAAPQMKRRLRDSRRSKDASGCPTALTAGVRGAQARSTLVARELLAERPGQRLVQVNASHVCQALLVHRSNSSVDCLRDSSALAKSGLSNYATNRSPMGDCCRYHDSLTMPIRCSEAA
jgi:hypothetical protein